MNTPIYDFVNAYRDLRPVRLHMPGHKGRGPLGCEDLDLTEIPGADSLYEAAGIIAESEANASELFGCPTFYSTEGSSHCIRAMLLLASQLCHSMPCPEQGRRGSEESVSPPAAQRAATENGVRGRGSFDSTSFRSGRHGSERFRVLAARNVHSAFLTAAALLDLDVVWLPVGGAGSYLSARPTPEALDAALAETRAAAVYLTCPDYLGELPDLRPLAAVCHARGALLLVDNAHGAYLRFLTPSRHPMDLGADLCCDSAHKTLPVLTGGAYLHVSEKLLEATGTSASSAESPVGSRCESRTAMPEATSHAFGRLRQQATDPPVGVALTRRVSDPLRREAEERRTSTACPYEPGRETRPLRREDVRDALALFGSTSPSYLILQSLDLANPWLESLPEKLADFLPKVEALKARLRAAGWTLTGDEPLKLTLRMSGGGLQGTGEDGFFASLRMTETSPGLALAAAVEHAGIFCEFADPEYVVFMLSPNNTDEELERLEKALVGAVIDRPPEADASNTGDGSLCSIISVSNGAAAAQHRKPSPVSNLRVCSIRNAMLAPAVRIPAGESLGRVLARPGVSCPPAVPILMPGEIIDEDAVTAFEKYGISEVSVLL